MARSIFFSHIGNARFISFVLLSTFRMLKAALLQAGTCGAAQLQRCSHCLSEFAPLSSAANCHKLPTAAAISCHMYLRNKSPNKDAVTVFRPLTQLP